MKGRITVRSTNNSKKRNKKLTSIKNITANSTFIDNVEDLDIVMPMYNPLEYNDNYSMTSGNLWKYYRDKVNDDSNENKNAYRADNEKITKSKTLGDENRGDARR